MTARFRVAVLSILSAALGACGGAGGGGGSSGPTDVTFTSFSAVAPNQTVHMRGDSVTLSGTTSGTTVTPTDNGPMDSNATVRLRYDGNRQLAGISATLPHGSFSIDASCDGVVCSGESTSGFVVGPDAASIGWNYQTFGVWGQDLSPTTFKLGAVSAGSPTSGSSLPLTGTATFNGIATGAYIDVGGNLFATGARLQADVDFEDRSIVFATRDTTVEGVGANSNLNLNGTLRYNAGVNSFSGDVTTAHPTTTDRLNGKASGRFYGPSAQEIGGVYSLSGTGPSRMVGGFGGKR